MRCTARASPVGGVRRRANAFSLCGLSLHAGSPPLLRDTAWYFVSTARRIQARLTRGAHGILCPLRDNFQARATSGTHGIPYPWRDNFQARATSGTHGIPCPLRDNFQARATSGTHGAVTSCTRKERATAVWRLRSVHWPLRTQRASVLEEHISFSPQCRQSIMMVPARQR